MKTAICALSLAGFAGAGYLPAQSRGRGTTFQAETALVRLDVRVEQESRTISDLRLEDFVVYDEEQPQPVLHFSTEFIPLDVVLLLDASCKMHDLAQPLGDAALAALPVLQPDDRVALMVFDRTGKLLVPLTSNRASLVGPIRKLVYESNYLYSMNPSWRPKQAFSRGGGDFYESLRDCCRYLRKSRRSAGEQTVRNARVVLMMTDGIGARAVREKPMLRDLWEADAVVDTLILDPSLMFLRRQFFKKPMQDVVTIANETGGVVVAAGQGSPSSSIAYMLQRSRTRYVLHYRRPDCKPGTMRHVKVELAAAAQQRYLSARVHTRRFYYSE